MLPFFLFKYSEKFVSIYPIEQTKDYTVIKTNKGSILDSFGIKIFLNLLIIFSLCFFNVTTGLASKDNGKYNTDKLSEVNSLLAQAEGKIQTGNKDWLKVIQIAIKISKENHLLYSEAEAYHISGRAWKSLGDFNLSIEYLAKSINIFEQIGDSSKIADVLCSLGETYRASSRLELAEQNIEKSMQIFIRLKDTSGITRATNRLAACLFELSFKYKVPNKYLDSAKTLALESQKNAISNNDIDMIISNKSLLGAIYRGEGKFDKAISYFNDALNDSKLNNVLLNIPEILFNKSLLYLDKKDYRNTIILSKETYDSACKNGLKVYQLLASSLIYRSSKILKQSDTALKYLEISTDLYNKTFYINLEQQISEQRFEMESRRKERELAFKHQEMIYQSVIFGIAILLLLVVALIFFFKNKHQKAKNKILSEKNQLIENQKKQLTELNATKDKFFSIISHDLKSPVGSFKNSLSLMNSMIDKFTREEINSLLCEIQQSAEKVYTLLEDLLSWSRSQRGTIQFNPDTLELGYIVDNVIETIQSIAKNKNITINKHITPKSSVYADNFMLNTILRNIISNSIKFTPENGTITIIVHSSENSDEIIVSDTGTGMSQETIDKLFKIDSNYTTEGTSGEKGTGLGLILCKEFVDKHNGKLWVESEVGKGTSIHISLPKKKS